MSAGKCEAMGALCTLEILQCGRHKCAYCNKTHHAIAPCGFEHAYGNLCGRCNEDDEIFRDFTEKGYAQRNLEEQRESAATLALERERLVSAVGKSGGLRNLAKKKTVKEDLIGRKLHREGRVAEAAMKDKGIIPGEISDPEVVTAGDSGSVDDSDVSFGGFPPLPKNPPMPGDEEYATATGRCPALGRFCLAPTEEYLIGDKCHFCCLSVHFKSCSIKTNTQPDNTGSENLLCNTCKDVGSDSADEREAGELIVLVSTSNLSLSSCFFLLLLTSRLSAAAVAAAAPKKRDPNFKPVEDKYLATAWGCVSEDSRKGTGQKGDAFNTAVTEKYNELVLNYNSAMQRVHRRRGFPGGNKSRALLFHPRGKKNVMNRWGTLKAACSKWAGIEKSLPKPPSGDTDGVKLLEKRNELWRLRCDVKTDFPHEDAYDVLRKLPKWQEMDEDRDKAGVTGTTAAGPKKKRRTTISSRPVGKRAAALNDKISTIARELDVSDPTEDKGMNGELATLTATLGTFAETMAMQMWEEEDRKEFMRNQAQIKLLQQKKEMRALMQENKDMMPSIDDGTHFEISNGVDADIPERIVRVKRLDSTISGKE